MKVETGNQFSDSPSSMPVRKEMAARLASAARAMASIFRSSQLIPDHPRSSQLFSVIPGYSQLFSLIQNSQTLNRKPLMNKKPRFDTLQKQNGAGKQNGLPSLGGLSPPKPSRIPSLCLYRRTGPMHPQS